jgi:hypothetical protein
MPFVSLTNNTNVVPWTACYTYWSPVGREISWTVGSLFTLNSYSTWICWLMNNNRRNLTPYMHSVGRCNTRNHDNPAHWSRNHMLYGESIVLLYLFFQLIIVTIYLTLNDSALRLLPLRIFCHSVLTLIYFLFSSIFDHMLPYFIFYIYSPPCTFYTILTSLYIILLLRHSVCFILHDMLYILILYLLHV